MSEQDAAEDTAEGGADASGGTTDPAAGDDRPDEDADASTEESTEADQSTTEGDDGPRSTIGFADSPDEESDGDLDVAEEVEAFVETASTAELAEEIATLRFEVDTLEADVEEYEQRVEDLESKLKRKQADFENYKKRMKRRREEEKERATEDLVTRLVDVRDNLKRAVDQDEDADIRDGVETTLRQFDRVLEEENVTPIEPDPGDEVDPERHEVLVRMDSDQPPGTIAQVHRPGYEMAGKVIQAAQVAVSEE